MKIVQAGQYGGVVGDGVSTVHKLFGGGVWNGKRSNGAASVKLLYKSSNVRKIGLVFPCWQATRPNYAVEFYEGFLASDNFYD